MELQIERAFTGEELVWRMKGWVTVDPQKAIDAIQRYGRLKVLDDRELVVEVEAMEDFRKLQTALHEVFGHEMDIELIQRKTM